MYSIKRSPNKDYYFPKEFSKTLFYVIEKLTRFMSTTIACIILIIVLFSNVNDINLGRGFASYSDHSPPSSEDTLCLHNLDVFPHISDFGEFVRCSTKMKIEKFWPCLRPCKVFFKFLIFRCNFICECTHLVNVYRCGCFR